MPSQYVTLAYKNWCCKVTINEIKPIVSILKKSMKANSSKQEKRVEVGSWKSAKDMKCVIEGSTAEEDKSCDNACAVSYTHLTLPTKRIV